MFQILLASTVPNFCRFWINFSGRHLAPSTLCDVSDLLLFGCGSECHNVGNLVAHVKHFDKVLQKLESSVHEIFEQTKVSVNEIKVIKAFLSLKSGASGPYQFKRTTSVTRKKSPNVYKSCPKMIDFDTFTKIALECGRFGPINCCKWF